MISAPQSDSAPLLYIQRLVGGGVYYRPHNGFSGNPIYVWKISRPQLIKPLIKNIYSYLRTSRVKKRARCIYQIATLIRERKIGQTRSLSEEDQEKREKIYKIWGDTRQGKKRGPRSKRSGSK